MPGLRPTPGRIRETLFNWLQPRIPGSRCLDLFAGTGALGFEALSRGAAEVIMVERNAELAQRLAENARTFGAAGARIVRSDAIAWLINCLSHSGSANPDSNPVDSGALRGISQAFDIVFLDPPFGSGLLPEVCMHLDRKNLVAPGGAVYLETAVDAPGLKLPETWELVKNRVAGGVRYCLAEETRSTCCIT